MGAFSSPDWDAVPDVYTDGRSILQYPNPAPELTAKMWEKQHAYRAEMRAADEVVSDDSEVYMGYEAPIVYEIATEFDDPCRPLAGLVKLAHGNGWELVELSHALSFMKGKAFAGGDKAGQRRPDRRTDLQWAKLQKSGVGRILLCFPVVNDAVVSANVMRRFNGLLHGDRDMRKILKGEYVREEQGGEA